MNKQKLRIASIVTLLAHLVTLPVQAAGTSGGGGTTPHATGPALTKEDLSAFSMSTKELGNVREYYSSNKDHRFLIRVHVWGDTPLSGIHYIPDNSTLLDAVSYAGGPSGNLPEATLTLHRLVREKGSPQPVPTEIKIEGKNLASNAKYVNFPLQNGDVLYLDVPPKSDSFAKNLSLIGSILAIVSTGLTIYLVTKR